MTNPIGRGSCNLPINLAIAERAEWGKLACAEDKSLGEKFREMALEWAKVHRPDVARRIEAIRSTRMEILKRGGTVVMLGLLIGYLFAGGSAMRRPARAVRVRAQREWVA